MKLIIKEYLSQLKESGELDLLLPSLLLAMGIEPLSHAQVGVKQYGVDIAAIDKSNKNKGIHYLFTIKQGDIGRKDWDIGVQAVRPSLNQIRTVYIQNYIRQEHQNLKKIIVLCTSGEIKQELELDWKSYTKENTIEGEIEFEFWGGDKLAILIEQFMFSEYVLPFEFQSLFRRTLVLIDDLDYDLSDYTKILEKILSIKDFGDNSKLSVQKQIKKNLRTIHLCVNIIWSWSKQNNNIRNAIFAAEKTVLITWHFLIKNKLNKNAKIGEIYTSIYFTLIKMYIENIQKVKQHCCVEDGLFGYNHFHILGTLIVFEQIGLISIIGIEQNIHGEQYNNIEFKKNSKKICELIKRTINNHHVTTTPLYDNHSIDISLAILLLSMHNEHEFIDFWICEMINNISFSFLNLERYFPISSDSFDDLITLNIVGSKEKSELFNISTLIPILAQWATVLNLPISYNLIIEIVKDAFPKTSLQMWYPDSETENHIYINNAAHNSGAVDAPIKIPDTIEEMKEMIKKVQKNTIKITDFSSFNNGFFILPLISCRHFRTPFLPQYIQLPVL